MHVRPFGCDIMYEENRKSELTRIAYTYAKTGKPCEVFGRRIYKLDNFSGPGGISSNIKQDGVNFYYDWVVKQSNFYNKVIVLDILSFMHYKESN